MPGMAKAHTALIAAVLKNLGHVTPSDAELTTALKQAFLELKKGEGLDPDNVKYKLALVPIERDWVKATF